MYSYEERKKAVELYIKFDKSASDVVRELGYPTTRMLTLWYREYLENGDLHKKSRMQSGYTAEQKAVAVKYYQEHGRGLARTAKALGYPCRQLLGKWVSQDSSCDFQPLKKEQPVVKCTDKQKMAAVVSVASGEKTSKQIQAEIGVSRRTVWHWKRQLLGEAGNPEMKKKSQKGSEKASSEQEIQLRAECNDLKEERDRLQKQEIGRASCRERV